MTEYVTLLGSENVQSAANTMRNAAETFRKSADTIDHALMMHKQFLEDWLQRFEAALSDAAIRKEEG